MERQFTSEQVNEMLQALVENDKETYINLEYVRAFVNRLQEDQNISMPWIERKFSQVLESYSARQKEVRTSPALAAKNIVDFKIWEIKRMLGLGALPIVPVAIGAIGTVVTGVIVWQLFKPKYSDSERDLKVSKDLRRALDSVSPATKEKIIEDLEQQIDKAYKAGQNQGALQVFLNTLKWGVIAGGIVFGFIHLFPKISSAVDQTRKKLNA